LIWRWAVLALVLHLSWEIGHLPFYTLWAEPDAWRVALYVAHCTLGRRHDCDPGLSGGRAGVAAHGLDAVTSPRAGGTMLVALGLGYTAFSEWYNVYRLGSWAYADAMPLVFGIGLTPLLQWLIVPVIMLVLIRRIRIGWSRRK
jgi:hypothetical protein